MNWDNVNFHNIKQYIVLDRSRSIFCKGIIFLSYFLQVLIIYVSQNSIINHYSKEVYYIWITYIYITIYITIFVSLPSLLTCNMLFEVIKILDFRLFTFKKLFLNNRKNTKESFSSCACTLIKFLSHS